VLSLGCGEDLSQPVPLKITVEIEGTFFKDFLLQCGQYSIEGSFIF
jgi:hypothetical protein